MDKLLFKRPLTFQWTSNYNQMKSYHSWLVPLRHPSHAMTAVLHAKINQNNAWLVIQGTYHPSFILIRQETKTAIKLVQLASMVITPYPLFALLAMHPVSNVIQAQMYAPRVILQIQPTNIWITIAVPKIVLTESSCDLIFVKNAIPSAKLAI